MITNQTDETTQTTEDSNITPAPDEINSQNPQSATTNATENEDNTGSENEAVDELADARNEAGKSAKELVYRRGFFNRLLHGIGYTVSGLQSLVGNVLDLFSSALGFLNPFSDKRVKVKEVSDTAKMIGYNAKEAGAGMATVATSPIGFIQDTDYLYSTFDPKEEGEREDAERRKRANLPQKLQKAGKTYSEPSAGASKGTQQTH